MIERGREAQRRQEDLMKRLAEEAERGVSAGRVILTIGSVRLEIEENETKIYISSPKTQVTHIAAISEISEEEATTSDISEGDVANKSRRTTSQMKTIH